jgi:hypothetical protein
MADATLAYATTNWAILIAFGYLLGQAAIHYFVGTPTT